jgi:hypothetical protein
MAPERDEEPVRTDSPAGTEPAGESGASAEARPTVEVPVWGLAYAAAEAERARDAAPAVAAGEGEDGERATAGSAAAATGTAEYGPVPAAPPARRSTRARLAFRAWRRSRPFWGGLLVLLGGGEIIFTYHAPLALVMHFGLYGLAGYLVPGMLVLLGLLIVFDPQHRTFYSLLAVLAALGTWLTSNLGGFILGMLLGLIGGSLAFGWQTGPKAARRRERKGKKPLSASPTH